METTIMGYIRFILSAAAHATYVFRISGWKDLTLRV